LDKNARIEGVEIPKEIKDIINVLEKAKHEAYLVGGCVRDLLMGREPKDWDIATNAKPEKIQKLFPDSVYENNFGTVAVKTDSDNERLKIVEITTYRKEGKYTDKRHPDEIKFAKKIEDDLGRRDFTINAMAMKFKGSASTGSATNLVDPYEGRRDLDKKVIRTVGNPDERFNEDALRLLRAVRLAAELGFEIEKDTTEAIKKHAGLLEMIAKERIRDELEKLIMADKAGEGIRQLQELKLLHHIIPELEEGVGIGQNKHHVFTVLIRYDPTP